jgi:hypothetical protein
MESLEMHISKCVGFDHINPMLVASMIAKVVNLPREEDMGTPTSNSPIKV